MRDGGMIWTLSAFSRGGGRPPPHRPPGGALPLLGARWAPGASGAEARIARWPRKRLTQGRV